MKKIIKQEASVKIDFHFLERKGITKKDVKLFIPEYIFSPGEFKCSWAKYLGLKIAEFLISLTLKLCLCPRKGKVGNLNQAEVESVYAREASTYNWKHHVTTRGQDLQWRRQAAFNVLGYALNQPEDLLILDLCTGTGLTIKEILKVLAPWSINAKIIGLDFCIAMLNKTQIIDNQDKNFKIEFVRGDATNMTNNTENGFVNFPKASFNVITQMFGLGGIDRPLNTFKEVLKLLLLGGRYYLIDMHKPISELSGEWFFLGKWLKMPIFDNMCYEKIAIPLVLNRLWAWRDTTPLFYLLPLITYKDGNNYYGFKILQFEYNAQRWWLALPIMTIAKICVEKIIISEDEARKRSQILAACSF